MASAERREELGVDAATDALMARIYRELASAGAALSIEQIEELPGILDSFDPRNRGYAGRFTRALEALVLAKAVETGPADDGPAYRARPGVDVDEWRAPDER